MPTVSRTLAVAAASLLISACSLSSVSPASPESDAVFTSSFAETSAKSEIVISTQESLKKAETSLHTVQSEEADESSENLPIAQTSAPKETSIALVVEPDAEETESHAYLANAEAAESDIDVDIDIHPDQADDAVPVSQVPTRTIDISGLDASMYYETSEGFVETLLSGNNKLYYTGDTAAAEASLSEIVWYYCQIPSGIAYHTGEDELGTFLQIDAGDWNYFSQMIRQAKAAWNKYFDSVRTIASGLDLASEDWKLVNQIRDLILEYFSYNVTDSSMMDFLYSQTGQCYHYAKLFEDLCQAVGISARIAATREHAWNEVHLNGSTYLFDATHAQATGNVDAYSWQAM